MANPVQLARYAPDHAVPAVSGGRLRQVKAFVEGSAFAWALTYVGFAVMVFVLLAAVLLAPVLAIAFPVACAVHDARETRRAVDAT